MLFSYSSPLMFPSKLFVNRRMLSLITNLHTLSNLVTLLLTSLSTFSHVKSRNKISSRLSVISVKLSRWKMRKLTIPDLVFLSRLIKQLLGWCWRKALQPPMSRIKFASRPSDARCLSQGGLFTVSDAYHPNICVGIAKPQLVRGVVLPNILLINVLAPTAQSSRLTLRWHKISHLLHCPQACLALLQ